MEELTLEELIKYAVRIQQDSFLFYRKAVKMLVGNQLELITAELADFKALQLRQLKELLSECTLGVEDCDHMVEIDTTLIDEILDNGEIPAQATPREVLLLCLSRENKTQKTYRMVLDLPSLHRRVQEAFNVLSEDEQDRIGLLRRNIEEARQH
jgi:rubrerythrin